MDKLSLIELEHLYVEICYICWSMHASTELADKMENIAFAIAKK